MQLLTHASQVRHVIQARRRALGLTQQALAGKLALSQNRLSQIETDPRGLTLERLIDLFNALGLELVIRDRPPSGKKDW